MSSKNNRLRKPLRLDLHSRGDKPRTPNDVHIILSPQAKEFLAVVKPCLERSLEKYRELRVARLASAYCGGSIIVLTMRRSDSRVCQCVCTSDEMDTAEFADWKTVFDDIKANPSGPAVHGSWLFTAAMDAKLPPE
jgi:hypothetical protein